MSALPAGMDLWCRCNKCGELFVAADGTNFADLRCPSCKSNESISVRSTEGEYVLEMDGTYHTSYDSGCCSTSGKVCSCGGWMHYQPVYGGYYYQCERCKEKE